MNATAAAGNVPDMQLLFLNTHRLITDTIKRWRGYALPRGYLENMIDHLNDLFLTFVIAKPRTLDEWLHGVSRFCNKWKETSNPLFFNLLENLYCLATSWELGIPYEQRSIVEQELKAKHRSSAPPELAQSGSISRPNHHQLPLKASTPIPIPTVIDPPNPPPPKIDSQIHLTAQVDPDLTEPSSDSDVPLAPTSSHTFNRIQDSPDFIDDFSSDRNTPFSNPKLTRAMAKRGRTDFEFLASENNSNVIDAAILSLLPPDTINILLGAVDDRLLISGRTLGYGEFAEVKAARLLISTEDNSNHATKVALKIFKDTVSNQRFYTEALRHSLCRHPSIISYIGICNGPKMRALILERSGKSLYDMLGPSRSEQPYRGEMVSEKQRCLWAIQITQAVCYLHSKKWYHLDLNPKNVVISLDREHAKLTDFGLLEDRSTLNNEGQYDLAHVGKATGTYRWMSPEMANERCQSLQDNDLWGLGLILWEIFTGMVTHYGTKDSNFKDLARKIPSEAWSGDHSQYIGSFEARFQTLIGYLREIVTLPAHERPEAVIILDELQQVWKKLQ